MILHQKKSLRIIEYTSLKIKANTGNFVDGLKNKDFVELLNMLEGMAYGEEGIPIDKWVSYDMAMLPSPIIGFCERSKTPN